MKSISTLVFITNTSVTTGEWHSTIQAPVYVLHSIWHHPNKVTQFCTKHANTGPMLARPTLAANANNANCLPINMPTSVQRRPNVGCQWQPCQQLEPNLPTQGQCWPNVGCRCQPCQPFATQHANISQASAQHWLPKPTMPTICRSICHHLPSVGPMLAANANHAKLLPLNKPTPAQCWTNVGCRCQPCQLFATQHANIGQASAQHWLSKPIMPTTCQSSANNGPMLARCCLPMPTMPTIGPTSACLLGHGITKRKRRTASYS